MEDQRVALAQFLRDIRSECAVTRLDTHVAEVSHAALLARHPPGSGAARAS
jgi:hypothetical protein